MGGGPDREGASCGNHVRRDDPAPWEQAGATWCLTGFGQTPRADYVRAAIAAGP